MPIRKADLLPEKMVYEEDTVDLKSVSEQPVLCSKNVK